MAAHAQASTAKVYGTSRWQPRAVAGVFLVIGIVGFIASGVVLPLIVFGLMGAGILYAGERTALRVTSDGVTSIPPFGQPRTYPWSDIGGFEARRIAGGYGSWTVSVDIRGEWIDLTATRRGGLVSRSRATVEEMADELNAELQRVRERRTS
jgi:hypothetical protein